MEIATSEGLVNHVGNLHTTLKHANFLAVDALPKGMFVPYIT